MGKIIHAVKLNALKTYGGQKVKLQTFLTCRSVTNSLTLRLFYLQGNSSGY